MAAPVIIPELQFIDADGHPYAGGSLATYVVGTSTPKATWIDPQQSALQTNPAVLDAAGRCLMWGDGEYRLMLRDAAGNLIWDQPATTIVSAAMAPIVAAPTIADAKTLLGITDTSAELSDLDTRLGAETSARTAADTTLTNNLNSEIARATAAENAEQEARIAGDVGHSMVKSGTATADASGYAHVTFDEPFPVACHAVRLQVLATGFDQSYGTCFYNNAGANCYFAYARGAADDDVPSPVTFAWIAVGE